MKSTQKGNQYEREVRDILEAQEWMVEGQHRKVMWIRDKMGQMKMIMAGRDIYGCDLIVKKHGFKSRWIQVSTVPQKSSKERQVLGFPINLDYEDYELWLRIDGKRAFRVFKLRESEKGEYDFVEVDMQECVKVTGGKRVQNVAEGA